jgi:hypothetical protein
LKRRREAQMVGGKGRGRACTVFIFLFVVVFFIAVLFFLVEFIDIRLGVKN